MIHPANYISLQDTRPSPATLATPANLKHRRRLEIEIFDDRYNSVQGETSLWAAVITQALMDALGKSRNPEMQYHKHEAIRWLIGNSKDFQMVCHLAGMDPDYVRRKAKKALINPTAWRAAPGTGKRYQERKAYREKKAAAPVKAKKPSGEVIIGPWA